MVVRTVIDIKSYTELMTINGFEERFDYLKLEGSVGLDTFGFERFLNQVFYRSKEWRSIRNHVIVRDSDGDDVLDMAWPDRPIVGQIYVHHINPITAEQIQAGSKVLTDPENLICVSKRTHLAIHYGYLEDLPSVLDERKPNDTAPWLL